MTKLEVQLEDNNSRDLQIRYGRVCRSAAICVH